MGIQKPNLSAIWADQGAIIAPTDAKVRLGWVAEVPPNQWENWVQNRQDRALAYLMQKGLPEWDAETEYVANKSFIQRSGNIYKCIITNTGNDPATSPTFWDKSIGLGLGTAAYSDVTTNNADITNGRILKVGDVGTNRKPAASINFNTLPEMYSYSGPIPVMSDIGSENGPPKSDYYYVFQYSYVNGNTTQVAIPYRSETEGLFIRSRFSGNWSPWREIYHSGNFNPSTKVDKTITISAGTGLSGGGDLSQNRALSVAYGTTANTSAQGNDTRIVNSLQKSSNLSDLNSAATARTNLGLGNNATGRANLGLGNSATLNVGTAANTVAAGNDSRIVGSVQKNADLSDLANIAAARSNLGLKSAAVADIVGTMAGGSIIERGVNSNGEYVRFADGTQICWVTDVRSPPANIASGSLYRAELAGWSFPAAFSHVPAVFAGTRTQRSWVCVNAATTSQATFGAMDTIPVDVTYLIALCAVGRWKN